MASFTSATVLDWTLEKFNGFKLRRLVIDGGTQALRNFLHKCHPGKSIQAILAAKKHKIHPLIKAKVINQFVVDGVDESCDSEARSDLVDLIAGHLDELPKFIRFLITTRPEKNIVAKFSLIKPFFLKNNDLNNTDDLRKFFKSKLSLKNASTTNIVELSSRCDGNMLYAFFLFEIFKEKNSLENLEHLASGLTNVFKMYFKRLEIECMTVSKIDEHTFLSLLSAMVASQEPLPLDFVLSIFDIKRDTPSEKRNSVKALNCISLLFVITDNRVSFFHKSVKDWLVSEEDHDYKINEKNGHSVLAKLCSECFDNVLKTTDLKSLKPTDAENYAFKNGFYHMLKDGADGTSYVNSYLTNMELLYYCVKLVRHKGLWAGKLMFIILKNRYKVKDLVQIFSSIWRVSRKDYFFSPFPKSAFLQTLILDMPGYMSSKALELYPRFLPELPYFKKITQFDRSVDKETIGFRSGEKDVGSHVQRNSFFSYEDDFRSSDVRNLFDYVALCLKSGVVVLISIKPFNIIWMKVFAEEEISCSCISFHPHQDIILPGRLDQVLSLTDGSWQPSPFSCAVRYFFTECCFSPDNTIMITGNDHEEHLVLWDLFNGEKMRHIEVSGPVSVCFSFSPDGNHLAVFKSDKYISDIIYLLFDVTKNYSLLQRDKTTKTDFGKRLSLTGYKSDTWLFFDKFDLKELWHDVRDFKLRTLSNACDFLIFPSSTKAHKIADLSITSQVMTTFDHFRYLLFNNSRFPSHVIFLHSLLQIAISRDFSIKLLDNKLTCGNISFDGQYFYQHDQSLRELRVLRRDATGWIFLNRVLHNVIAFAVVKNGVFVVTVQGIIETWNIETSERVMSSQLLKAIECCELVSDYLIACVGKTKISFIDSRDLQEVSVTSVSENQRVMACSSKYDVLVNDFENGECFIMRDDKRTHSLYNTSTIKIARFCPNANKLVLYSKGFENYRCYEISENSLRLVNWVFPILSVREYEILYFLDDEYFITISSESLTCAEIMLSLNCAHSGKVLTCFELGDYPTSVFYCRETQILIVNYTSNAFKEFRVHWPRREFVKS